MTVPAHHPDVVGRYLVDGRNHFFPVRRTELDRTAASTARTVATFRLTPGRHILTVSLTQEVAQFAPFEQACATLGLIGTNADASPFDAARVEAIVRQFDIAAICGIDAGVLEGLAALGHDAAALFAGRVVWARPDAYAPVAAMAGVVARRCALIGPLLALECSTGEGLHVDGREWAVADAGGTIALTSRMARITPLAALDTHVRGRSIVAPCPCGNPDPRITLTQIAPC